MNIGRNSPLAALALPGVFLLCKYSEFRARRREAVSRRSTERELQQLHHKIDKLLNKLEQNEPELATSQEDECVICINARATMQTSPCGHRVVCRRCFVKTIQSAVAQRLLPLRCVICRARVTRLQNGRSTWKLRESASSYSMSSKSWQVPGSASSYSVGTQSLGPRVPPSASLYSMSSGSSCISGVSSMSSSSGHSSGAVKHHVTCHGSCMGAVPKTPQGKPVIGKRTPIHPIKLRIPDPPGRLPPIKEFPRSPARSDTPPAGTTPSSSTRIRCAQNLVTQLETTPLLGGEHNSKHKLDEKSDNKKNETAEKKKEDKIKMKAEKDARKEEKKQAREEERQAKQLAKDEKKKNKKEAKQGLLTWEKDNK